MKTVGADGPTKIVGADEPRLTLSSEEKEKMLSLAVQAHETTGGAPVEVSNSRFKVKIGAWPDKKMRDTFTGLLQSLTLIAMEKTEAVKEAGKKQN